MLNVLRVKIKSVSHAASLACMLHCVIAPFVIVLFPMIGGAFDNLFLEYSLLAFSILCGVGIVYKGYCKHKKAHALLLFLLGITLWGVNSMITHEVHNHEVVPVLLVIGTIFVLVAYYLNHRELKCCPSTCCDKDTSNA